MELLSKNSGDSYPVLIGNIFTHIVILPIGILGYIEVPISSVKQPLYQIDDFNKLIQEVVHSYHPDTTEPINVQYQDMT